MSHKDDATMTTALLPPPQPGAAAATTATLSGARVGDAVAVQSPLPPPSATTTTHDALHTTFHYDMYATEYGSGTPVYAGALCNDDDDDDGLRAVAFTDNSSHNSNNNSSSKHAGDAAARALVTTTDDGGFRSLTGAPSAHELWRFRRRGCQDAWAAVLFAATLLLVLVWGGVQWWQLYTSHAQHKRLMHILYDTRATTDGGDGDANARAHAHGANITPPPSTTMTASTLVALALPALYACALLSLCLVAAVLALRCVQRWPHQLIVAQCWVQAGVLATVALYLSVAGATVPALLSMLFAAMTLLWLYLIRDRIPFSSALLAVASQLVRHHVALVALALVASLLFVLYALLTAVLLVPVLVRTIDAAEQQQQQQQQQHDMTLPLRRADTLYIALACVALFWCEQVLQNTVHVVTAGVTATWYFTGRVLPHDDDKNNNKNKNKNMSTQQQQQQQQHTHDEARRHRRVSRVTCVPRGVVRAALSRALTTSFGSICLGSLLVAVIRFVRFLANAMTQSSSSSSIDGGGGVGFLSCVALCLLACLEAVVQYFNEYAFIHCAVYGCAYVEAAQRTWRLTRQCLFAAVFNDALVAQATSLLTLCTAALVAGVVGVVMWSAAMAVVSFLLAAFVTQTVLQIVLSVVTTLFVCFAEVPEGLRLSFPELYDELLRTDAGMTHGHDTAAAAAVYVDRAAVDEDVDVEGNNNNGSSRRGGRVGEGRAAAVAATSQHDQAITYGSV